MIARKAVLLPLLVAAAAGCSGGDSEVVVPPPLPEITAQPTPRATPTPAALPSAARASGREGAAAFARYYYEQVAAKSFTTLDSAPLRALADSSCATCELQADSVDAERGLGHRYEGGQITVRTAVAAPPEGSVYPVNVIYDSAPLRRVDGPADATPGSAKIGVALELRVRATASGWKIMDIARGQA